MGSGFSIDRSTSRVSVDIGKKAVFTHLRTNGVFIELSNSSHQIRMHSRSEVVLHGVGLESRGIARDEEWAKKHTSKNIE
jgi:hypothetical protein